SSLNHAYRGAPCAIEAPRTAHAPFAHHGVCEMPIASFEDYPGHIRHAQLCACSAEEMIGMLKAARRAGWRYFIIVSHSFELLNRARTRANRIQLKRFERLCGFLEQHNDEYVTCGFDELDPDEVITNAGVNAPLSSRIDRTARRMAAQAVGHILYERG
ncbi:MAG: polysaccharide deacetylase, partial [Pseudomonadota bacterium]